MATVLITMTDGSGNVLDTSTTTMPDAVLQNAFAAMAWAYQWQSGVANPSFNPAMPVGSGNPQTIPNPTTYYRNMAYQWYNFTTQNVIAYNQYEAKAAAVAAVNAQVNTMQSGIIIT